ncbi:MAG: response regulator [Myxococcota bacterium]
MATILAVDDSATMRKCLEITFSGTEFEVVTCATADEALEKVKTIAPSLVIADVSLPPSDGYQLCATLKLAAPDLPVVMLSSKQNPFDASKGSQADGHIDKPFDTQVLQDRVRELADASRRKIDTDIPGSPGRAAQPLAGQASAGQPLAGQPPAGQRLTGSMLDRSPSSSKIPAPKRKRPTPAMMVKPQLPPEPEIQTPSREARASASAAMRRTVPFAMPGGGTKPGAGIPAGGVKRGGPAAGGGKLGDPAMGGGAAAASASPPATRPLSSAAEGAAATNGEAAVPAVALGDDRSATLEQRLGDLGLTRDQMDGVLSLSRDLIEQAVWEVVPVLAETLIKEEIARLTKDG